MGRGISRNPVRYCGDTECERLLFAKGFCKAHYERERLAKKAGVEFKIGKIGSYFHSNGADVNKRNSEGHKRCTTCETWRSEACFGNNVRTSDGFHTRCLLCETKDKVLRMYSITIEQVMALLESQSGSCAICLTPVHVSGIGEPRRDSSVANIDHDHACCSGSRSCGKCVRGILCGSCNRGLGFFKDNTDALSKAATYLTR